MQKVILNAKSKVCLVRSVYFPHKVFLFFACQLDRCIVNCCLEALGLYVFVRNFRRAYKPRGLHPKRLIAGIEKALRNKL